MNTGADCINPLEPVANMEMAEVEHSVVECIRNGARGGGLIVSSSNSIHSGVSPRNYAAMIRAVHTHGRYAGP